MCGIVGAFNIDNAAESARNALLMLQHRGQDGAGIATIHKDSIFARRKKGSVDSIFPQSYQYDELPGNIALAQTRYRTNGSLEAINLQPFVTKIPLFALAHNGSIVNEIELLKQLKSSKSVMQSNSDSELLLHFLAHTNFSNTQELTETLAKVSPEYAVVCTDGTHMYALRDRCGVRPLFYCKKDNGYLIASETIALDIEQTEIHEVQPGQMVVFSQENGQATHTTINLMQSKPAPCTFEYIYFSHPRSKWQGTYFEDFRRACGKQLYHYHKAFFDKLIEQHGPNGDNTLRIVPILDSGNDSADGFCDGSLLHSKKRNYVRRHKNAPKASGRSFIADSQEERMRIAHAKQHVRADKVKSKVVITVDDSLVRGTTTSVLNTRLRKAGAAKIINIFASPPLVNTCPGGMDHKTLEELFAHKYNKHIEKQNFILEGEIAQQLNADALVYLPLQELVNLTQQHLNMPVCSGCFGGNYYNQGVGKSSFRFELKPA